MKRKRNHPDMLKECDFSRGVRGKYAKRHTEGTIMVMIDPDVAEYFPDHDSVNEALRSLIPIMKRQAKAKRSTTRRRGRSVSKKDVDNGAKLENDPVVEEVRKHRMEHTKQFGGDLAAICADLCAIQEASGHKVVRLRAKRMKRLARECTKLDPAEEKAFAEEGYSQGPESPKPPKY